MTVLALLVVLGLPAMAMAQQTPPAGAQAAPLPPDIPPGTDRIVPATQGQPAAFTGMLLDTDTAIRWTNRARWYQEEFRLHLTMDASVQDALRHDGDARVDIVTQSYQRLLDNLRQDLRTQATTFAAAQAREHDKPFWESWGFSFTLGVIVAGVLVGFVAWALSSLHV